MSTGQASRALVLTSALLETGVWRKSTAFRQHLQAAIIARVAQREPAALYPASHQISAGFRSVTGCAYHFESLNAK